LLPAAGVIQVDLFSIFAKPLIQQAAGEAIAEGFQIQFEYQYKSGSSLVQRVYRYPVTRSNNIGEQ